MPGCSDESRSLTTSDAPSGVQCESWCQNRPGSGSLAQPCLEGRPAVDHGLGASADPGPHLVALEVGAGQRVGRRRIDHLGMDGVLVRDDEDLQAGARPGHPLGRLVDAAEHRRHVHGAARPKLGAEEQPVITAQDHLLAGRAAQHAIDELGSGPHGGRPDRQAVGQVGIDLLVHGHIEQAVQANLGLGSQRPPLQVLGSNPGGQEQAGHHQGDQEAQADDAVRDERAAWLVVGSGHRTAQNWKYRNGLKLPATTISRASGRISRAVPSCRIDVRRDRAPAPSRGRSPTRRRPPGRAQARRRRPRAAGR